MGIAFSQFCRAMAGICEDTCLHSDCCTNDEGCACDAATHKGGGGTDKDIDVHVCSLCWLEAHEGQPPNLPKE